MYRPCHRWRRSHTQMYTNLYAYIHVYRYIFTYAYMYLYVCTDLAIIEDSRIAPGALTKPTVRVPGAAHSWKRKTKRKWVRAHVVCFSPHLKVCASTDIRTRIQTLVLLLSHTHILFGIQLVVHTGDQKSTVAAASPSWYTNTHTFILSSLLLLASHVRARKLTWQTHTHWPMPLVNKQAPSGRSFTFLKFPGLVGLEASDFSSSSFWEMPHCLWI